MVGDHGGDALHLVEFAAQPGHTIADSQTLAGRCSESDDDLGCDDGDLGENKRQAGGHLHIRWGAVGGAL
ncbi:unannotated protein [freshwater metagenome]|uniref:Unannotated protein n=1 Tax=freshwater metagenome TaxID=449393 RepID=A0A6J6ZWE0_9ZZZZ